MKRRIFIRLNFISTLIFLAAFIVILIAINPFEANIFLLVLFYIVFFGLVLSVLNLIGTKFKIPFWIVLLISIVIVFLLILSSFVNKPWPWL